MSSAAPPPPALASLDDVERMLHERGAAGLSLAVMRDGDVEHAGGHGFADLERRTPVRARTLFQAGSVSKPVAALAAMCLVDRGRLGLDDDVNDALRSWRVPPTRGGWTPRVTLRMLLTHTAGLTLWGFPGYRARTRRPDGPGVLRGEGNTPEIRPESLPRVMWRYSGGGYTVAQQLVADVAGKPFDEVARELVLEPLGMRDSTFEQPVPARVRRRAASAHALAGVVPGRRNVYPEMAAAGLWTTPSDLLRFARGFEDAVAGRPGAVVSKATAAAVVTGDDVQPGMGLGLMLGTSEGLDVRSHGGANLGFLAQLAWTEGARAGVAVMVNAAEAGPVMNAVATHLAARAGHPQLLSPKPFTAEAAQAMQRVAPVVPADRGGRPPAGRFALPGGAVARVTRAGELALPAQPPMTLRPAGGGGFTHDGLDVRLTPAGAGLRIEQLGRVVHAKRL